MLLSIREFRSRFFAGRAAHIAGLLTLHGYYTNTLRGMILVPIPSSLLANSLIYLFVSPLGEFSSSPPECKLDSRVNINNTCIKRGIKRYYEELSAYQYLPKDFENLYMSVIEAKTVEAIRNASYLFLAGVIELYEELHQKYVDKPIPTYENLEGTYEEAWCNMRNKVLNSVKEKDKSYAFLAANGAQSYFDEMTFEHCGTKKINLMKHFDPDDLEKFQKAFLQAMDDYLHEYEKVGRAVKCYSTFEELYNDYMKK